MYTSIQRSVFRALNTTLRAFDESKQKTSFSCECVQPGHVRRFLGRFSPRPVPLSIASDFALASGYRIESSFAIEIAKNKS